MIINGKKIANNILHYLQARLKQIPFQPILCDVLVGDDPVSLSYVKVKQRTAKKIGVDFHLVQLPEQSSTEEVIAAIRKEQTNPNLCGLIVQLPLPHHIHQIEVLAAIDQTVDVDVINPESSRWYYRSRGVLVPPTAGAILEILLSLDIDLKQQSILVIGQGDLVGKPITHLLQHNGYEVVTADQSTTDLSKLTKAADVVISGTGQGGLITGDMVKPGAIVIDAGTSESGAGIVGDVEQASVENIAAYLSPVPGGVGPVTVAKLLENVVLVAQRRLLGPKTKTD
jgi:methylenetetrahydrofolate dehydrogenase (NADP+) / methenyltetrahydrofolate cyclohydrolase